MMKTNALSTAMRQHLSLLGALLLLSIYASTADAQTVYKQVDKNGKVTYSDTPPKKGDLEDEKDEQLKGKKVELPINRDLNVYKPGNYKSSSNEGEGSKQNSQSAANSTTPHERAVENLKRARAGLVTATATRDAGIVATADDFQFIAGANGAAGRAIPKASYLARLKSLDDLVPAAEKAVEAAEKLLRETP
jgi:Domain of unknown function (DUF4124)